MTAQQWRFTGASEPGPGISAVLREQLQNILLNKATDAATESFIIGVDTAVSTYRATHANFIKSTPGQMRKNLKAARSKALKLNEHINNLDGNSRALLADVGPGAINGLYRNIGEIINLLDEGLEATKAYDPAVKRQEDTPRLILAAHIRHLISKSLSLQPRASENGLFENILKAIFSEIKDGRHTNNKTPTADEPSVHSLALRAMSVKVTEHEDGVLEIDPLVN